MRIEQILTIEEMFEWVKKVPSNVMFDIMSRSVPYCFECVCATEITNIPHTIKGFRFFFQLPQSLPKEKRGRQKIEVDPVFADWAERFVARSTAQNTSTLMSSSAMYNMLENLMAVKEERAAFSKRP